MLQTINWWLGLSSTSTTGLSDEYETWKIWQNSQPNLHYDKSAVFDYYVTYFPKTKKIWKTKKKIGINQYYEYCFGKFAMFITNPSEGGELLGYIKELLKLYDTCKGLSRRLKGDPEAINVLRDAIRNKSLVPLRRHNFLQYEYPYHLIHAHTVAQYSLSTLIMRLVSHYMAHTYTKGSYAELSVKKCQSAYEKQNFGKIPISAKEENINKSDPISIDTDKELTSHGYSWPRDRASCMRCQSCNRICENVYGDFVSCIDCHFKRICSLCGTTAVVIGHDELPKCARHS